MKEKIQELENKIKAYQEEMSVMEELLLEFIDLDDYAEKVMDNLEKKVHNNPENFIIGFGEEAEITDTDIDTAIEEVWNGYYYSDYDTPTIIYEKVHENISYSQLTALEDELHEIIQEGVEYQKNPMKYNGLKQADFL